MSCKKGLLTVPLRELKRKCLSGVNFLETFYMIKYIPTCREFYLLHSQIQSVYSQLYSSSSAFKFIKKQLYSAQLQLFQCFIHFCAHKFSFIHSFGRKGYLASLLWFFFLSFFGMDSMLNCCVMSQYIRSIAFPYCKGVTYVIITC